MNTTLKSSRNLVFLLPEPPTKKNGLRKSPINDDLPSAGTLGTPKNSRLPRRSHHHDA
jgi:hypothetical protein